MRSRCLLSLLAVLALTMSAGSAHAAYVEPTLPAVAPDSAFGGGKAVVEPFSPGLKHFNATAASTGMSGAYLVAGSQSKSEFSSTGHFSVVSLTAQGQIDEGFGVDGGVRIPRDTSLGRRIDASDPVAISMQSDGKILVASLIDVVTKRDEREYESQYGTDDNPLSASHWAAAVVRLTSDGKLDRSFGRGGMVVIRSISPHWVEGADSGVFDVKADGRGRPILFAWSQQMRRDGKKTQVIYRLRRDGKLDRSFGSGGRIVIRSRINDSGSMPARLFVGTDNAVYTVVSESGAPRGTRWVLRAFSSRGQPNRSFGKRGVATRTWSTGYYYLESIDFLQGSGFVLSGKAVVRNSLPVGVLERFSMRGSSTGSLGNWADYSYGEPFTNVIAKFTRSGSIWTLATTSGDGETNPPQHLLCIGDRLLDTPTLRTCREAKLPSGYADARSATFFPDRGSADKYVGRIEQIVVVDNGPVATPSGRGFGVWRYELQ